MVRPTLILVLLAAAVAPCAAEGQKADEAQKALADAKAAHKLAVEHAQDALRKLEDLVRTTRSEEGARRVAAAIEQGAAQVNAGDLKEAQEGFQSRLSEVAAAKSGSIEARAEQASRAAEGVTEVSQRQARETRKIWAQMQGDKKKGVESLYEEAKKAAKETAKTAKSLEHAAHRAGADERDADPSMDVASRMEDHAKDLRDEADDGIESFFNDVEGYVERQSDVVAHEAQRRHEGMRESIRAAVREAHKKQAEQAQRAKQEAAASKDKGATPHGDDDEKAGNESSTSDSSIAPAPVLLLAQQPSDAQPEDGKSADSESHEEPAQEPRKQKAEDAKEALADAQEAHKKAVTHAEDALRTLEDFVKKTNSQKNARSVAEAIGKGAAQVISSELEESQTTFKDRLSSLAGAEGKAVNTDTEKARRAADDVAQATRHQAHQTRNIWAQMQKDKKQEAKALYEEAKKAAKETAKTAKSLEHAARHAGVSESDFQRDADQSMDAASRMEDHAQDLRDKADDGIERFFGEVEGYMERHSDALADEAHRHLNEMHESIRVVERKARKEQAAQRLEHPAAPQHAAAPKNEEEKSSSADDEIPAPSAFLGGASPRSSAGSSAASGVAGLLILASMGFGFLAARFPRRRAPRGTPLLLG